MPTLGYALLTLLSAGASGGAGTERFGAPRLIRAHRIETHLVLNGDPAKWRGAHSVSFQGRRIGGRPPPATASAPWHARNLYLAFFVHSSKLQGSLRAPDGDKLLGDDGSEILLD